MNSQKEKESAELAGFAPASRGAMKSAASGAQASTGAATAAAAAAAPSASDNRIAKKNVASSTTAKPAAAATKKRSKSSSKVIAAGGSGGKDDSTNTNNYQDEATTIEPIDSSTLNSSSFQPISLPQIQLRIKLLLDKLPANLPQIPPDYINPDNNSTAATIQQNFQHHPPIKSFASSLQTTIEEYNLLLSLVSSATYQWGVDRSGASQQNLSVMNSELQQCQDVISSVVTGRLSNVLCPAVDVLVGRVEIVRGGGGEEENGGYNKKRKLESGADANMTNDLQSNSTTTANTTTEQRINHYTRPLVDPSYVHLCHQIVARNSEMLRYTVATCIHTAQRVIGDYLKAMKKDVGHEANKGGYY